MSVLPVRAVVLMTCLVMLAAAATCAEVPPGEALAALSKEAARLAAPGSDWPTVTAAQLRGNENLARRLHTTFAVIESAERLNQPIDPATERRRIGDYLSIARTLRKAGGYGNHVLAETALRLAVFRLGRWMYEHPEQIGTISPLVDEAETVAITHRQLALLTRELPPPPDRFRTIAPASRAAGPATKPSAHGDGGGFADAAAPAGADDFCAFFHRSIVLDNDPPPDASTARLLGATNVPALVARIMGSEYQLSGPLKVLRDLVRANVDVRQPSFFEGMDKTVGRYVEIARFNSPPAKESLRYEDVARFRAMVSDWPDAPVPAYYTAVDGPRMGNRTRRLQVTERSLGRLPARHEQLAFGPGGTKWAVVAQAADGRRVTVLLNGKPVGQPFDAVGELRFTADDKLVGLGSRGKQWFLLYDGSEVGPYGSVRTSRSDDGWDRQLHTSSDGRHIVIIATAADRHGNWAVYDGRPIGPFAEIRSFAFSPADSSLALSVADYDDPHGLARDGRVVHGDRTYPVKSAPVAMQFSPDGKRIACVTASELAIVGDLPQTFADNGRTGFAFTPDSGHIIRFGGGHVYVDDRAVLTGDWPAGAGPKVAPDGRFILQQRLYKPDGTMIMDFERSKLHTILFGPDASEDVPVYGNLGAVLRFKHPTFGEFVVRETFEYAATRLPGGHFALSDRRQFNWVRGVLPTELWLDGKRAGVYFKMSPIAASPDGKTLAWNGRRFSAARVVINGIESEASYDELSAEKPSVARVDGTVRTIGVRAGEVLAIEAHELP